MTFTQRLGQGNEGEVIHGDVQLSSREHPASPFTGGRNTYRQALLYPYKTAINTSVPLRSEGTALTHPAAPVADNPAVSLTGGVPLNCPNRYNRLFSAHPREAPP
ncbi:hypothetical protein thsps117_03310 [Pseudomonas sp. No.117]